MRPEDLERLGRAIQAAVRAVCRVRRAEYGVEDLVNEVWVKLCDGDWRRLRSYDPQRGASLETYVKLIAKRVVYDQLRRQRSREVGHHDGCAFTRLRPIEDDEDFSSAEPTPEEHAVRSEALALVDDHLRSKLSAREHRFFRLRFVDGLDYDEVERAMGAKSRSALQNTHSKILRLCTGASEALGRSQAA